MDLNQNGRYIKDMRKMRGMELTELAKGICSPSMLQRVEAGESVNLGPWAIQRIADRLEVPVTSLYRLDFIH